MTSDPSAASRNKSDPVDDADTPGTLRMEPSSGAQSLLKGLAMIAGLVGLGFAARAMGLVDLLDPGVAGSGSARSRILR